MTDNSSKSDLLLHAGMRGNLVEVLMRLSQTASTHRDACFFWAVSRTAMALEAVQEAPQLHGDLHCYNLMVKIGRAGTVETMVRRLADLHFYLRGLAAASKGQAPTPLALASYRGHASHGQFEFNDQQSGQGAGERPRRIRLSL